MKKLITSAGLFLLILSGAAYGQSTTLSTNPKQGATSDSSGKSSRQGARKTTDGANNANKKSPGAPSTTAAPNATSSPSAAATPAGAKKATTAKDGANGSSGKNDQAANQKSSAKTSKTDAPVAAPTPKAEPKTTGTGGARAVVKNNQSQNPSDLEVKKGSGSAERNIKNLTGKTGNYKNEAIKKDQPKP